MASRIHGGRGTYRDARCAGSCSLLLVNVMRRGAMRLGIAARGAPRVDQRFEGLSYAGDQFIVANRACEPRMARLMENRPADGEATAGSRLRRRAKALVELFDGG